MMVKIFIKKEWLFMGPLTRRELLTWGAGASILMLTPWSLEAARVLTAKSQKKPTRSLWLYNTHTGETIKKIYWEKGIYLPCALKEFNKILRDHRSGDIFPVDRQVLDLLSSLRELLNYQRPFDVISGYRSARTNTMLRRIGRKGVARNSYHTKGKAIDIHFRGLSLKRARDAACSLKKGGVGYYPGDGFIHVDVRGKPVHW